MRVSIPLRRSTILAFEGGSAHETEGRAVTTQSKATCQILVLIALSYVLHRRNRLKPRGVNGRNDRNQGCRARNDEHSGKNSAALERELERIGHQKKLSAL